MSAAFQTSDTDDIPIDPALLPAITAPTAGSISPEKDTDGNLISEQAFNAYLETFKTKERLRATCTEHNIQSSKRANLAELRHSVLLFWYPQSTRTAPARPRKPQKRKRQNSASTTTSSASHDPTTLNVIQYAPPEANPLSSGRVHAEDVDLEDGEDDLIARFNPGDLDAAEELLQYVDEGVVDEDDGEDLDLGDDDDFEQYQAGTRIGAAKRAETNRRPGGLRTQKSVVKSWDKFLDIHLAEKKIRDRIVDVHSLLLFIKWSAERPKMNRKGEDRPGTFISASQLKKLFFGVLRVRKVQEAADPTLSSRRPASTVHVYDAIKNRMDEALERERSGLVPAEDAPDIIANTFLAQVTDEQLEKIGHAFLEHPQLRMVINGHLAWVCQAASGNRGDDFRALKLCETQPYTWLHPNGHTGVYSILGLQGEEKAGKRGMKTTINPVYTTFIAHVNPEVCPLGAFAFYSSYIHDYYKLTEKMEIDWSLNKSWRKIRLLFGNSPIVPYNESNLYNLYCKAYARAGFSSKIKVHMARRQLGYKQERMGVDANETAKLGWSRGTYVDTYAPALAKKAILGAHGYKVKEAYDPVWRRVRVPEAFLLLVCPMAEGILKLIEGAKKPNLTGAANYWQMVINLRPYFFQCGAALYHVRPDSALFRLPAFENADVQNWMSTTFRSDLSILQASAGSPVDLQHIENETIRVALEEQRVLLSSQATQLKRLTDIIQRRTTVFSPTQGYSQEQYVRSAQISSASAPSTPVPYISSSPGGVDEATRQQEDAGVYLNTDGDARGYICPSPSVPDAPRPRTQVDLVLPPAAAFSKRDGMQFVWPPILGQRSAKWEDILKSIQRPAFLWDVWKPRLNLAQSDIATLWTCYNVGEAALDSNGVESGIKPPLRLVEQHFNSDWRPSSSARKAWQRFREIPEWIETQSKQQCISPQRVIAQLEAMRHPSGTTRPISMTALMENVKRLREDAALSTSGSSKSLHAPQATALSSVLVLASAPLPSSDSTDVDVNDPVAVTRTNSSVMSPLSSSPSGLLSAPSLGSPFTPLDEALPSMPSLTMPTAQSNVLPVSSPIPKRRVPSRAPRIRPKKKQRSK